MFWHKPAPLIIANNLRITKSRIKRFTIYNRKYSRRSFRVHFMIDNPSKKCSAYLLTWLASQVYRSWLHGGHSFINRVFVIC